MAHAVIAGVSLLGKAAVAGGTKALAFAQAHPFLTLLGAGSVVSSGFQAVSSIRSANAQARQLETQREAERLQNAIQAQERQRQLRRTLASQNALFGAAGIDVTSGTPQTLAGETVATVNRIQNQADLFSSVQQSLLTSRASDVRSSGTLSAVGGLLGSGISLLSLAVPSVATPANTVGSVPLIGPPAPGIGR